MSAPVVDRIRSGARAGLALGGVLAIVVVAILLFRGTSFLERTGTRLKLVVAVYLIGGPLSGAIAMSMVPLTKRLPGAVAVGMIAVAPLYLGGRVALRGLQAWDMSDTVVIGACCILVGGLTGALVHHGLRGTERPGGGHDLPSNGR